MEEHFSSEYAKVLTSPRGQAFLSVKLPVPVAEKEKEKEMEKETEKETERKKEREKGTEREKETEQEVESPQQCLRKSASGGRGHYSKYDA